MKKMFLMVMAAMMVVACGKKEGTNSGNTENADNAEVEYTTYTNEKYGFSVEVPAGLKQIKTLMPEDGTVYSADEGEFALNRIDIGGSTQMFDEEYTPEKVKHEFETWLIPDEATEKVCGDNYFSYTVPGEMLTELHKHLFSGTKVAMVVICYDKEHEAQLGGDVAKHVFESIKFQ